MNIMNRITLNMLRQNKRRTIVTIIGIILSTAMIAAVSTFSASFSDLFYRQEIDSNGDWHVSLRSATNEDIKRAQSDFSITRAGRSTEEATSLEETSEYSSFFSIIFCEESVPSLNGIKASEGRLPNAAGEIALPEDYNEQNEKPITIGQTITLPIGELVESEDEEHSWRLSPTRTETFTVVGFLTHTGSAFAVKDFSYFDALPTKNFTFHLDPLPSSLYATLSNYPEKVGVQTHSSLLYYSGIYGDMDMMEALFVPIVIVGLIIFIASIMLIYNAFSISVSERSRQFGMLASIGATRKQKRNAVFFEGLVLGAIAIPIGIVCGIIGIGITFRIISPWMMEAFGMTVPLYVKVVPLALLGAVLFSAVTIFVSAWIPARRAARTTPIDAIRQTADIKLRAKKVKTSKFVEKLFGFEGTLALKNLKRYAKRYRATVFSLTVSIILFLTTATFTSYMGQSLSLAQTTLGADVLYVRYPMERTQEDAPSFLPQNVTNELRALDTVTRMQAGKKISLYAGNDSLLSKEMMSFRKDVGITDPFELSVIALDPQSFAEYCKEAKLPADILAAPNAAIVVNQVRVSSSSQKYAQIGAFSEKIGQTLPISWNTWGYNESVPEGEDHEQLVSVNAGTLTLAAYTDVRPLHVESAASTPTLIISEETFDAIVKSVDTEIHSSKLENSYHFDSGPINVYTQITETFSFKTTDSQKLVNLLNDYQGEYGGYTSDIAGQMRTGRRMLDMMNVFFYGFITLITLVAVANVFNTISTGITLRTREFAMLRSVGMTKKGFNRMIRLESVFYGLKSLLYGLPISIVLCVLMYMGLNREFGFPFFLPVIPILIVVCTIFFIVSLTMLYSTAKVKKTNIVSALTSEVF